MITVKIVNCITANTDEVVPDISIIFNTIWDLY